MDRGDEQGRYMKATWKEFATVPSGHLNEDELIRYHRGGLNDRDQARVESHLAECRECLETFADASEFLQAVPEGHRAPMDEAHNPDFEALWQRLSFQASSLFAAPRPPQTRVWAQPRVLFTLAASLFVALALSTIWALSLRQANQRLAERGTEPAHWAERLRDLEQENRGLQEQIHALQQRDEILQQEGRRLQGQISTAQQRYESELAQLKQPEANVPVRNIYPRDNQQRSTGQAEANRISIPLGTRTFIMILSDYDQGYEDYEIEIVDPAGHLLWKALKLRPDGSGDLTVMLNRTLLGQKRFIVKLYGQRDRASRIIAEYVVRVE